MEASETSDHNVMSRKRYYMLITGTKAVLFDMSILSAILATVAIPKRFFDRLSSRILKHDSWARILVHSNNDDKEKLLKVLKC